MVDQHSVYHKTGWQQNNFKKRNYRCRKRERRVCVQSLFQSLIAGIQVIKQSDSKQVLQRLFGFYVFVCFYDKGTCVCFVELNIIHSHRGGGSLSLWIMLYIDFEQVSDSSLTQAWALLKHLHFFIFFSVFKS